MDTEIKLSGWNSSLMAAGKTKLQEEGSLDLAFSDLSYCVGKGNLVFQNKLVSNNHKRVIFTT
jgi:hypothetical protein